MDNCNRSFLTKLSGSLILVHVVHYHTNVLTNEPNVIAYKTGEISILGKRRYSLHFEKVFNIKRAMSPLRKLRNSLYQNLVNKFSCGEWFAFMLTFFWIKVHLDAGYA